jgi:hypothetical protein
MIQQDNRHKPLVVSGYRNYLMIRIFLFFLLLPNLLVGQSIYEATTSIPVRTNETELLTQAWAGGFNAVQFNTIDLDNDQQQDLVLFDRTANKLLTYLSRDQVYTYTPEYEKLFPSDLSGFVLLRDFNGDGKKDIFTGSSLGIKVFENTTQGVAPLSWEQYLFGTSSGGESSVLLTIGFSGKINLQLQFDDLPSIEDVDSDGDLDIICASFSQEGRIEFHKNVSTVGEPLQFERTTQAWGNFIECSCGQFSFNNEPCAPSSRSKHAGGKSLLAIDVDNDAKTDLIFSESNCDKLYLLHNEGTSENAVFTQAEIFPAAFQSNGLYASAFFEDVDFDGVKDILVSSAAFARTDEETDWSASARFFKNTGTNTSLQLDFLQNDFLQSDMIDVGENAIPAFFDYDADGDLDLFVSNLGKLQPSQVFASSISLFENIGTSQNPVLDLVTDDYESLSSLNFYNVRIQFVDINQDGKVDLVFTATNQSDGTALYCILNTATNGLLLSQTLTTSSFDVFFNENVHVTEINNDGLRDLLVGKANGAVEYWKNTGTADSPAWQLEDDSYLNLTASLLRQNPSIATGDLNKDAQLDLILGDQKGVLRILSNFKSQTDFALAEEELIYNTLTKQYENRNLGGRIWATIAPFIADAMPTLVIGNMLGGLQLLQAKEKASSFEVYPNPVAQNGKLFIEANVFGSVQFFSSVGKTLQSYIISKGTSELTLPVQQAGVYLLRFTGAGKTVTRRIVFY